MSGYDNSFNNWIDKKRYWKNESIFALKTNLASIKTEVDKFDINKLVPVPVGLIKWVM